MAETRILVSPPSFQMGSTETWGLAFDGAHLLAEGQSFQSATASLVNMRTGVSYTGGLIGDPSIDEVVVTQVVSQLEAGSDYRLVISTVVVAGIYEPAMALRINCPF